ncbi:hypothetical protein RRG08_026904 [Elysia crispata]|uniref:Uncharacterized protein n=1 Tax=Elysia crispata TaxID=231223 RepID=A0AAE1AXH2_9GAST|nr:hypothetical protein RRG08_026904 [Elysia crispata]
MPEGFAHSFNLKENDRIVLHKAQAEIEDFVTEIRGNQLVQNRLPQPERDAAERAGADSSRETSYNFDIEKEVAIQNTSRHIEEQPAVMANLLLQHLMPVAGCIFRCSRRMCETFFCSDYISNYWFSCNTCTKR